MDFHIPYYTSLGSCFALSILYVSRWGLLRWPIANVCEDLLIKHRQFIAACIYGAPTKIGEQSSNILSLTECFDFVGITRQQSRNASSASSSWCWSRRFSFISSRLRTFSSTTRSGRWWDFGQGGCYQRLWFLSYSPLSSFWARSAFSLLTAFGKCTQVAFPSKFYFLCKCSLFASIFRADVLAELLPKPLVAKESRCGAAIWGIHVSCLHATVVTAELFADHRDLHHSVVLRCRWELKF